MMNNKHNILVTCICITYNHKDFIRKCLDGMLMQKTNFQYEIIVYDDCSTDGTREIVKEYAAKHPELIRVVLPDENQYSKIGDVVRETYVHPIARGKYAALCEGDDFWNNPNKLQLQADFMEANSDYAVCFHEVDVYDAIHKSYLSQSLYKEEGDFDITTDLFLNAHERISQPLSMMYRLDIESADWPKHYSRYCDTMEIYHLLRVGKGRMLRFVGGQYNLQSGGISATNPAIRRSKENCEDFQQMWNYTHDPVVAKCYTDAFLWRLEICKENKLWRDYWQTTFYALMHNSACGKIIFKKAIRRFFVK